MEKNVSFKIILTHPVTVTLSLIAATYPFGKQIGLILSLNVTGVSSFMSEISFNTELSTYPGCLSI